MSFARGMFNKAASAGSGGARRPRPDTLCELRWHQPLPTDGDSARAVSAAICDKVACARAAAQRQLDMAFSRPQVLPSLPPVTARDLDEAQRGAEEFMRMQADELGAPRFVDVKARRLRRLLLALAK